LQKYDILIGPVSTKGFVRKKNSDLKMGLQKSTLQNKSKLEL
jgi:hypothetical protein